MALLARKPLAAFGLCLLAAGVFAVSRPALAEPMSEYQVKAAFLYNFAKFVKWPESALPESSTTFSVCVLGDHGSAPAIEETIGDKTLRDKRIIVKRVASAEAARSCQILFASGSDGSDPAKIAGALAGASVLTVGEVEHFAERGGIVNFKTEDNKVRFEINSDGAKRANLDVSSQLLKLAIIVRDAGSRN